MKKEKEQKRCLNRGITARRQFLARFVKKQGTVLKAQCCLRLLLVEVWAECGRFAERFPV